ncbi:MAG: molybdenum cofactor guanylyltransferase [Candidatus Competibacteraceae bacterium]|nr:molybdenum cofactor guanylyltransferase [Candidatus Competibacteraceae bacterium]MCP5124450.1 molybdenum cofactor guanylyltransferase [Gammaproteobacteria bacterium]HRX71555.1 molybdenum cofactor guanylyltransferase MobA [Candidatus Competibacteraceae bacterium]
MVIDCQKMATGLILSGGRAERMGGQDKGLLPLAGEPLIAHGVRRLRPQVAELLISANRHQYLYRTFGCRVVSDDPQMRFRGPLAGVLAAMSVAKTPYLLTAPCDSPLLPPDYAQRMSEALGRKKATVSVAFGRGCWQPVFALLPVALQDDLTAWLVAGQGGAGRWLQRHQPAQVAFADEAMLLCNVNTPQDLARLEAEFQPDQAL